MRDIDTGRNHECHCNYTLCQNVPVNSKTIAKIHNYVAYKVSVIKPLLYKNEKK